MAGAECGCCLQRSRANCSAAQSRTRTASNVVCPKIGQTFRLKWLNAGSSIDRKVPGFGPRAAMRQTTWR
jgi:hypothetical protein